MAMWRYMPILKWKQGEQLALRNLTPTQWPGMTPLIELQPIDAAPDTRALVAALPSYLTKVSEQIIKSILNESLLCIDTSYLSIGYPRQIALVLTVCDYLRKKIPQEILPVFHGADLEAIETLSATQLKLLQDQPQIVLRLRVDHIEPAQIGASIEALASVGVITSKIHLLIDQHSLVNRKPKACLEQVKPYLDKALEAECSSVTLAGGSFPINLMGIPQGLTDLPRVEWQVWELLANKDSLSFADYAVTNPALQEDLDPSKMNPSIAIRYAAQDFWRVYKGRGFKSGVTGEYRNLCKILVSDGIFSKATFSYGDAQYQKAASGGEKNGNPSSWRKEATNHHVVLTASSL